MKTLLLIACGLTAFIILITIGAVIYLHFSPPPRQIQIGMSFQEFNALCSLDAEDLVYMQSSTTETASGVTFTLNLPFSEKHRENSCYGTFVFVNDKLTSVTK